VLTVVFRPIYLKLFAFSLMVVLHSPSPRGAELTKPAGEAFMGGRFPSKAPAIPTDFELEIAFTNLTFQNPMGVTPMPGSDRLVVWEREGKVWSFQNAPGTEEKKLILDLSIQCQGWGAAGLFSIAFHPAFETNGSIFVYYTWVEPGTVRGDVQSEPPEFLPGNYRDRLSRFTMADDEPPSLDSEVVLIDQITDSTFHSGGSIFFHPKDGFLYWCNGDDTRGATQVIDQDLLSGVFRIDVDKRGGDISHPIPRQPSRGVTANYYIPNDNPFVGVPNALEEFFALGLRNPYRMSVDQRTHRIFIGDVGNFSREEIDVIEPMDPPGLNFQWAKVEGAGATLPSPYVGVSKGPLLDYPRADGGCIIGGVVYHGAEFTQELGGKYIFGDNSTRTIWVLDESTLPPRKIAIATLPLGAPPAPINQYRSLSSFGIDNQGELLICQLSTTEGRLFKLVRRASPPPSKNFPPRLSDTGIFEDIASLRVSSNMIPYDVNSPLWSDGAAKSRWFTIPKNTRIGFSQSGEWQFPAGSVFVKHFTLPVSEGLPREIRRVETRVLVRSVDGGTFGATYKWLANNSDAELVESQVDEEIVIQTQTGARTQVWHYPSPSECIQCHTPASKGVLGLNTRQLNRNFKYGADSTENQLREYNSIGLFFPAIAEEHFEELPKLSNLTNSTASLEERARSYLDSNCSHCHRPGGTRAYWDARYETPLPLSGILNGTITQSLEIPDAKAIVPGHPEKSVIFLRANSLSPSVRMPPISKNEIDSQAIALLSEYIRSLPETTNSLPAGWQTVDIGTVVTPSSVTFSSDALSFTAGTGDVWSSTDKFSFTHHELNGDGEITMRIASSSGFEGARVGPMIRANLSGGSMHAYMALLNRRGLFFCIRNANDGQTTAAVVSGITAPVWVRITRSGDTLRGAFSFDGVGWSEVGATTMQMPEQVYGGFAATAGLGIANFVVDEISTINLPALNLRPSIDLSPLLIENRAVAGPVILQASAADPDGEPLMVEFFEGDTRLGQDTSPPFELAVNSEVGARTFSAKVYDNLGAVVTSSPTDLTVEPLQVRLSKEVSGNSIQFSHLGNPGIIYIAETSSDLVSWTGVASGEQVNGTVSFEIPKSQPFSYFRIRPR
jgi:uncharacterized repeat protein (TIGR03806 family)